MGSSIRRRHSPEHIIRKRETTVSSARAGGPGGRVLTVVQRRLGHANLGITSIYLQGIDNSEIIDTVFARPALML
jgi:integrase/recombinase XerD